MTCLSEGVEGLLPRPPAPLGTTVERREREGAVLLLTSPSNSPPSLLLAQTSLLKFQIPSFFFYLLNGRGDRRG